MKISKLLPSLALVTAFIATSSCGKLEDRINSLEQRISELENTRIPSIDEQVASIKKTIGELEKTDAGLREYISALEEKQATLETELGKTNAALTEAQKTLREEIAADKTELSGSVDAAKADVIAQLEAYKTLINGELETLNGTIESLKAKDEELQKNAEELRGYVDSENGKVRDWADATFATIEQQNKLAETVASIKTQFETLNNYTMNMDVRLTNKAEELSKSLSALDESTSQQIGALTEKLGSDISALRTELTDAYTKLIATEITKLETSMKSWVNEQLSGYYTIEQTDAKLDAMRAELTGRMDSDKAYLTTLITNLETATNRKISANAGLITGLRGDLTSLSQSVAENAGKIADDAILISQNTADISKNSTAIAANTKDLAAVKKFAEENQKLIAENNDKLAEMQRLVNELKDKEIANLETITQNTQDIASNASLIAKNAASIQSNAAAIAQNASDIQALQRKLDETKTELVEAYTAAIAKAINDYDGTITAKLASEIAKVDDKIQDFKSEIESIKTKISSLEDRVSILEQQRIVNEITYISYVPKYSDGKSVMWYCENSAGEKTGYRDTLHFELRPSGTAEKLLTATDVQFEVQAVYNTLVKSSAETVYMPVLEKNCDNDILTVVVSGEKIRESFFCEEVGAACRLLISIDGAEKISDYVHMRPMFWGEHRAYFVQSSISLFVGGSTVPEITRIPVSAPLKFDSSNKDVMTVTRDGKVTGVGVGDAELSVMTLSGFTQSIPVNVISSSLAINLSENGTANCYVVPFAGTFSFKADVKGNSSEPLDGEPFTAAVLWESFGTEEQPEVGDLIPNVSYVNGNIVFKTPDIVKNGNASIAVKDAAGRILWSWHIWICKGYDPVEYEQVYNNNAGTMMDRNLGATSATPGDVGTLGLLYQWGRKDPFLGTSDISEDVIVDGIVAKSTIKWQVSDYFDKSTATIVYATEHPTSFILGKWGEDGDWVYSRDNTRWQSSKTKYDPCPVGWRVPEGGVNGVWSKAFGLIDDSCKGDADDKGIDFSEQGTSTNPIWYPSSGFLDYYNNRVRLRFIGMQGRYWSVTTNGKRALCLSISTSSSFSDYELGERAKGYSVRCQKDEEYYNRIN